MARLIEYDVTGVEESSGGTGVKVKPGVRVCRLMKVTKRDEKRDGTPANDLEIALSFGDEFDWIFEYIGLDPSSDWKLAEFVRALGLGEKGKINPDKLSKDKPLLRAKVNPGEYGGNYRPEIGRLMKAQPGDEMGESISAASQNGTGGGAEEPDADEPVAEAAEATTYKEGFSPSREDDPEVGSYDDWEDADLIAECEDRGLTLPGGRGNKRDKAISALRAEDVEASGIDNDNDAAEPEATAAGDDYDDWDLPALVKEYEDRGFDEPTPAFKGRNAEQRTRTAIIEAIRADDAENPFES